MTELPGTPGTVIAIGSWWLVLLPPFEDRDSSYPERVWELLPPASHDAFTSMQRAGVHSQTLYTDYWVRTEVEQHGGYDIVAVAASDLELKQPFD